MKSVLAASLGLATLASANNVYPQHPHFNYRRQNGTAIAGGELTTLTVQTTSVRTIISCAPTVTNCPANSASLTQLASTAPEQVSTVLVTDVIQLATTICPVTEASGISSSVISVAATGGIIGTTITGTAPGAVPTPAPGPSGPLGNGTVPTPPITAVSPEASNPPAGEEGGDDDDDDDEDECEPDVTTEVSTSAITLTSAVPVTVTVTNAGGNGNGGGVEVSTSTSFTTFVTAIPVTKTVVKTESSPESTEESSPVGGEGSGEGTTISGTTTTTAYTTGTKTATLTSKVTKPTGDNSPVDSNSNSSGSGSGSGSGSDAEGTCVPETVTVTKEGPTVYVTVNAASPTGTSSIPLAANAAVPTAASASSPETTAPASTGGDESAEDDDTCEEDGEGADETSPVEGEDDTCDEEPEETVTATVVPVPTGSNGTGSAYPTGASLKNRFAKMY